MSPISIAVLAIGMSIDALLASIGRGAGLRRPRVGEAMKTGFVFGLVETITPLVGWPPPPARVSGHLSCRVAAWSPGGSADNPDGP